MYECYFYGETKGNIGKGACSAIIYKDNKMLFDKHLCLGSNVKKKEAMFYSLCLMLLLIETYCEENTKVLAKTSINLDVILNFMKNKNLKNICKEDDIRLDCLEYIDKIKRKNISIRFENITENENRSVINLCKLSLH